STEHLEYGASKSCTGAAGQGVACFELAVRVDELSALDEDREVGLVRDIKENRERTDEEGVDVQVGQVEQVCNAEKRDRRNHRPSANVGEDQERPPLPPIDPDPDKETEQEERDGPCRAEEAHLAGTRCEDIGGHV